MENAMITMKNINKGYMLGEERLPILKDINFQVNKGNPQDQGGRSDHGTQPEDRVHFPELSADPDL